MNKKEAKIQFLRKQLEDPNAGEFEKQQIRLRLGINTFYSEEYFADQHGCELLTSVSNYLDDRLAIIRRNRKTNSPIEYLPANSKTIYYLSGYSGILEEDSLEQLYEIGDFEDIKGLVGAFKVIGRLPDAELIESILNKGKITENKIKLLLDRFREDDSVISEIETEIEHFIRANIKELVDLQQ